MHNELAAQLVRTAAALVREDKAEGFRFPRGSVGNIAEVFECNALESEGRNGRTKYQPGTVAALLDRVAESLA